MTVPSPYTYPEERSRPIRFIKIMLFSASIMPAIVAGALAYADCYINWIFWLLAAVGLFFGQAGADYLYYYFTHYHTDSRDAHTKIFAGWRPLFIGGVLKNEHSIYVGFSCLFIALLIGIYFFLQLGTPILWLVLAGGLVSIFFTPLMLHGLKEPTVFITFGPLCMLGVDFVITQKFRLAPLMVSLPVGFLVTTVAYLKGARYKIVEQNGSEIFLNLKPKIILILSILAYISLIITVAFGFCSPWALLGLLPLPFSLILYRRLLVQKRIADYLWATVYALVIFIATCLFISVGLIISARGQEILYETMAGYLV
ncbi:MAG: prenyltransferase [Anaerolineaceae bacterium]